MKQNKYPQSPCDKCKNYNRYSIVLKSNGEIKSHSCHDKCDLIKAHAKKVAEIMIKETRININK